MIIISVTKQGDSIAKKIKQKYPYSVVVSKDKVIENGIQKIAKTAMENYKEIIFISSTGIAVRGISSFIKDKTKDPAVVVIDSTGKYVISLLSGHLGGANKLAKDLANYLEAQDIITTATDNLDIVAPDIISKENNLIIADMNMCKKISAKLIEGEEVQFIDEENIIKLPKGYTLNDSKYKVVVTNKINNNKNTLNLIRKNIVLGIGARKGICSNKMREFILQELKKGQINPMAISKIVSIDIKKDERCILDLAKYLNVNFKVYTKEEIKKVEHLVVGSDFVKKQIGVGGVSEPCVLLSGSEIIQNKVSHNGMTLCIGKEINNG